MYASAASLSSLRVLQSVNKQIDASQTRLSTGYKVNSAADNASVWAASQGIKSDLKSYDSIDTSLGYTKSVFDVTAAGADAVASLLGTLASKVTAAAATTTGSNARLALVTEITAIQKQLLAAVDDASFKGTNLLTATAANQAYTNSFSSQGATTSANVMSRNVKTTDLETTVATLATAASLTTFDVDVVIAADAATGDVAKLATAIGTAITNVTAYSARLGAASNAIDSNRDLLKTISDIKSKALSSMIETDMAEETTKLQALQVKQQLATQMLSMANSSQQNILRLFQ